ncbi:MAG: exodeoxyribonuclease VII large subunit, partial [Pseudonocardiales bacterium]|nr:exodeoxyribonuclease VII large subunit [Pseudonocardiales bacterium]
IAGLRDRARRALSGWVDREARLVATLRARPVLTDPWRAFAEREREVTRLRDGARGSMRRQVAGLDTELAHLRARLTTLGPAATLARGYAIVQRVPAGEPHDPAGSRPLPVLRSVTEAEPGSMLRIRLADGAVPAVVASAEESGP